jgi:hypothetical protein
MFKMVVINLGFVLITGIPIFLPGLVSRFVGSMEIPFIGIGILLCSIYFASVTFTIKSVSDYGNFRLVDIFINIKYTWKAGLVMGLFVFLLFYVITIILPFYMSIKSSFGLVLAAIVFWVTIFGLTSFQFYFTVYSRLGGKIGKSIKKCMLISLDNTGFALFLFIHNLIVILLPLLGPFMMFVFLFPGLAGILLYLDEALRLRLFKYDWLEANPDANRRKIPWEELIVEEREKTGHRSFKNFIFPWRD